MSYISSFTTYKFLRALFMPVKTSKKQKRLCPPRNAEKFIILAITPLLWVKVSISKPLRWLAIKTVKEALNGIYAPKKCTFTQNQFF